MIKNNFIKYLIEINLNKDISSDSDNISTNISDISQSELRRLSNMSPERRNKEILRKKRKEQNMIKSSRIRSLLLQKAKIEQLIQMEKDKMKKGG